MIIELPDENDQDYELLVAELAADNIELNYSNERMTELQEIRMTQARLEQILLDSIYERVATIYHSRDNDGDELTSAHYEGYASCLEDLWEIIEEHNENNNYRIKRNG